MYLNHVQEGLLTDGWVGSKNFLHPTYNPLYISHNYETWHSYTLIKEDPKKKKKKQITWDTHWVLLTSTFFTRLTIFVISWNKDQNYFLIHSFWFFWFFLSMIVRLCSKKFFCSWGYQQNFIKWLILYCKHESLVTRAFLWDQSS